MPHFIRIVSPRNYRVYELIKEHFDATCDDITFESLCLYYNHNRTAVVTALQILQLHRFISQCERHRYHPIDRKPLLMPFRGGVK
tara:strand:- start:166065 stop:166319 length:255 start_codon:yes stop_codon:yes gene_type:complete